MRFTDPKAEEGKRAIAWAAKRAWGARRPLTGPCLVRVVAIFAIPPSWPPAVQKAAREARVMHVSDPDLDQLVKQVKDALKGVAYVDDNQVCGYPNSAKRYGYPERTEITIVALPQAPDEVTPGQRALEKRIEREGWDAVLAPPKKKSHDPRPADDTTRARVTRKPRAPKHPPALQARIDAALAKEDR
jgi:Holliday junction resolvase RusA-like endonuclease